VGSLISHARPSLALPIALLAVAVRGSSALAPLVPSVGCAPLLASNHITARWTAVVPGRNGHRSQTPPGTVASRRLSCGEQSWSRGSLSHYARTGALLDITQAPMGGKGKAAFGDDDVAPTRLLFRKLRFQMIAYISIRGAKIISPSRCGSFGGAAQIVEMRF